MQLSHRGRQELFARVTVAFDGGFVHREKRERSQVVDPHWQRTGLEQPRRGFRNAQTRLLLDWLGNVHLISEWLCLPFILVFFEIIPPSTPHYLRSEERRVGKECRSRWS